MNYLELYETNLSNRKKYQLLNCIALVVNIITLIHTKSIINVILSVILISLMYQLEKNVRKSRYFIMGVLPHLLEDDGYYKRISTEHLRRYTYYYDNQKGEWVLEYPLNETEAKIISLNEFERFAFYSTINDYQPILKLTRYEVKEDILKWFENHPELNVQLSKYKIKGELEFEDIYK